MQHLSLLPVKVKDFELVQMNLFQHPYRPTELHLNKSVVVMTINQISMIAETGRLYSLQISRISDSDSALE